MRPRHLFHALILCALAHAAASAAAPTAPTDGPDTDGCDVSYVGGEAAGVPDYYVPVPAVAPVPPPLDPKEQSALGEQSYEDVYRILKDENECSNFFGGPAHAVEAFNVLARRAKRKRLDNRAVGMRMSGSFMTFRNNVTGALYRVFEEAAVNTDGPLFRKTSAHDPRKEARVGSFPSRSRQAAALVFLHELGHMVARAGSGKWLLENDGNNRDLSEQNTRTVEENCARQLTALGE